MKTYYNHKPLSLAYSYKYPRCVDYLIVDRTPFGSSESCGNDTDANSEQLDQGMIVKIKFCDDSIRKKMMLYMQVRSLLSFAQAHLCVAVVSEPL